MTFSLSIAHTPWKKERRVRIIDMARDLDPVPGRRFIHDRDFRGQAWEDIKHEWALEAWHWHVQAEQTHCVLMSDDLYIMPHFWDVLSAMVSTAPDDVMGLMSNHPRGPVLWSMGHHWYRCQAWTVGPCIVIPRKRLIEFVRWYEEWYPNLPEGEAYGQRGFFHDDSSINEWLSQTGSSSLHPLPAPIEHDLELGRSHDTNPFPEHAAEWISWRRIWHSNPARDKHTRLAEDVAERMRTVSYWRELGGPEQAMMLKLPSEGG